MPGDPSSAAFPLVAALIVPGSEVTIDGVGLNPLRTGLLRHARARWAPTSPVDERSASRAASRSPICVVRAGALKGVDVPAERAPRMIDEYPILAVAAACAQGRTVMRGLAELRVKESDRLAAHRRGARRAAASRSRSRATTLIVDGHRRAARAAAR